MSEQRFYAVMHHLATVLWMKGAAVEALAALGDLLEERRRERAGGKSYSPSCLSEEPNVSSPDKKPPVRVGDLIRVPEAHYLYGTGALTMRVTAIGADLDKYPSLEWVGLKGIETDDSEGNEREVLVRMKVLNQPGVVERPAEHSA